MRKLLLSLVSLLACACGHRQATYYDQALACLEQQDAPQALHYLLLTVSTGSNDSLKAQAYSDMGSLYFEQGLLDKALQAYLSAYHVDSLLGDSTGMAYDLRDVGNVYRTYEHDDSSLVCLTRALTLTTDTALRRDIESQMAGYHLWHGHYDEARRLLMPALAMADSESQSGLYYMAAVLYANTGLPDSAEYFYRQLLTMGTVDARQAAHRALAEMARQRGAYDEALAHLSAYEVYTDSVISHNDAEAVRRVAALYDYGQREQENSRLRSRILVATIVIVVLVGIIVAGLLYYSRKRLRFKLRLKELEQLLAARQQQPAAIAADKHQAMAQTDIAQLIQQRLGEALPLRDPEWVELERGVKSVYGDFPDRLAAFGHFSDHDYHVCLLLKLDLSPTDIATLTARTKQAITNSRSRLYLKTFGRKGVPTDWDEFIKSL